MIFQNPVMKAEFDAELNPLVRTLAEEAEESLGKELRITEVGRTDADSKRIYQKIAVRLLASDPGKLHGVDLTQYLAIKDLTPVGVENWSAWRPSWHKPFCAVDIGLAGWTVGEIGQLASFLQKHCPKPMWEVIMEPHGTGPHAHVARRDYVWLKDFPGSLRTASGRKKAP